MIFGQSQLVKGYKYLWVCRQMNKNNHKLLFFQNTQLSRSLLYNEAHNRCYSSRVIRSNLCQIDRMLQLSILDG